MRISDWSSDVCSSDLALARFQASRGLPPSGKIDMETLHRLGYSGPGSQPLANVTVRRVSAATSLGGQDRMANILFNIRRMKQEIGRAPDQRPVPVEILLQDRKSTRLNYSH